MSDLFGYTQDKDSAELPERSAGPPARALPESGIAEVQIMSARGGVFDEKTIDKALDWEVGYMKTKMAAQELALGQTAPRVLSEEVITHVRNLRDIALLEVQKARLNGLKNGQVNLWMTYARMIGELREDLIQHMRSIGVEAKYGL